MTIDEVLANLETSREGLNDIDIKNRIDEYGHNEIPGKKRSLILLLLGQFNSILVYILFGALALSIALPFMEKNGAIGFTDFVDAIAIGAILILNAVLGFFQELKAENAIEVLKEMSAPNVKVRRKGEVKVIPSKDIVPGDILLLEEGDRISADGRIIESRNCAIDEAVLTGESKPARKVTKEISDADDTADQINMVFKGTVVTAGRLEVCVTGTGSKTELGKIADLVSKVESPPTPLERSMSHLGRWLGVVVLFFCSSIFVVGVIRDLPIGDMLLASASLAVSAVPEGLPAIVTVTLAIGVQRMIKKRALTRKLRAIETLGSVTVICTDKTGTITANEMEVQEIEAEDEELLLQIAASCNNAHSLNVGDPTEIGLLKAAKEKGIERLEILEEDVPFSSESKYMMTSHQMRRGGEEEKIKFLKGAPEVIIEMCDLDEDDKEEAIEENREMAGSALRVLAFAYRDDDGTHFAGLAGMMDPPREGVKEAVKTARHAGIRTVMITGDHSLTAKAIAKRVGIESDVIKGKDLEKMSDSELKKVVKDISIFARVSPLHKVRILTALQNLGEIVAMGGDGVNDAPALKKAHVGFAMGKQGTDVARETAEMVLTDDHYSTVVEAVEEGRTIYDNIRKFVTYLLRANFDELMVVFGAILVGIPIPYLPIHILLRNLVIESFPAISLAMENPEENIMQRPPRDPRDHILKGEIGFIVLAGIIATAASFHVFLRTLGTSGGDIDLARTVVVTTTIMFELTLVFTCRSRQSLIKIGVFSNRYLIAAVSFAFAVVLLLIYSPLNVFVHLVPLSASQWVLPLAWAIGALVFFEGVKIVWRRST
jgi:P-type Ca2+ transporter type 2C